MNQTMPAQSVKYLIGTVISSKIFREQAKERFQAVEGIKINIFDH